MKKRQGVKSSTKGRAGFSNVKSKPKETRKYTAEEYLAKAEELVENLQPELAVQFYQRGLDENPTYCPLIDSFAQVLLDVDEFEQARQVK